MAPTHWPHSLHCLLLREVQEQTPSPLQETTAPHGKFNVNSTSNRSLMSTGSGPSESSESTRSDVLWQLNEALRCFSSSCSKACRVEAHSDPLHSVTSLADVAGKNSPGTQVARQDLPAMPPTSAASNALPELLSPGPHQKRARADGKMTCRKKEDSSKCKSPAACSRSRLGGCVQLHAHSAALYLTVLRFLAQRRSSPTSFLRGSTWTSVSPPRAVRATCEKAVEASQGN